VRDDAVRDTQSDHPRDRCPLQTVEAEQSSDPGRFTAQAVVVVRTSRTGVLGMCRAGTKLPSDATHHAGLSHVSLTERNPTDVPRATYRTGARTQVIGGEMTESRWHRL
jgi:hypothetical protein